MQFIFKDFKQSLTALYLGMHAENFQCSAQ